MKRDLTDVGLDIINSINGMFDNPNTGDLNALTPSHRKNLLFCSIKGIGNLKEPCSIY